MDDCLWDNESAGHDLCPHNKYRSLTYTSCSSDFVLYIEGYLIDEHHTLG